MSIVIGYASEKNSFIMSDGKATGLNASEKYDKTFKIGNHTIGGYVGFAEEVNQILNVVMQETYKNTEEVAKDMKELFDTKPPYIVFDSDFTMIGRDGNGILSIYLIGKSTKYKYETKKVLYQPGEFYAIGGTIPRQEINKIVEKHSRNKVITPLKKAQLMIDDIAKIDTSVNSNVFYQMLN